MQTQITAATSTREMQCWSCANTFDYLEAAWCMCVTRDQTIICPHCFTCACRANATVRQEFWINAPVALRNKRIERMRLDFARPDPQASVPAAAADKPLVLIADDSRTIRMMLRQTAERAGCAAVEAANGLEALAHARNLQPKLLIADALMPKLDGREIARILKSQESTRHIKVVIVSGLYTARRYAAEAFSQFGADEYLTKPVDADRLESVIRKFTEPAMAATA